MVKHIKRYSLKKKKSRISKLSKKKINKRQATNKKKTRKHKRSRHTKYRKVKSGGFNPEICRRAKADLQNRLVFEEECEELKQSSSIRELNKKITQHMLIAGDNEKLKDMYFNLFNYVERNQHYSQLTPATIIENYIKDQKTIDVLEEEIENKWCNVQDDPRYSHMAPSAQAPAAQAPAAAKEEADPTYAYATFPPGTGTWICAADDKDEIDRILKLKRTDNTLSTKYYEKYAALIENCPEKAADEINPRIYRELKKPVCKNLLSQSDIHKAFAYIQKEADDFLEKIKKRPPYDTALVEEFNVIDQTFLDYKNNIDPNINLCFQPQKDNIDDTLQHITFWLDELEKASSDIESSYGLVQLYDEEENNDNLDL